MTTTSAFCDDQWPATTQTPPTDVAGYVGLKVDPPSNHARFTFVRPWTHAQLMVKADQEASAKIYATELTKNLTSILEEAVSMDAMNLDMQVDPATVTVANRDRLETLRDQWARKNGFAEKFRSRLETTLSIGSVSPLDQWFAMLVPISSHYKLLLLYLTRLGIEPSQTEFLNNTTRQSTTLPNQTFQGNNTSSAKIRFSNGRKLPDLKITEFSGKAIDYLPWKANFRSYIDGLLKDNLVDYTMAFSWLIEAMKPVKSVATAMSRYPYNEDSWTYWFDELQRRYGCKITQRLEWLARIKQMHTFRADSSSVTTWRNQLEINLKGLEASGNDLTAVSDEIMAALIPKMPPAIRANWNTKKQICHELHAAYPSFSVPPFNILTLRDFLQRQDETLREFEQLCRVADLNVAVDSAAVDHPDDDGNEVDNVDHDSTHSDSVADDINDIPDDLGDEYDDGGSAAEESDKDEINVPSDEFRDPENL